MDRYLSKIAAAVGIVIAALSYRNQTKTKRSEWLKELFEKFYESDIYKEVRKWVDFDMREKLKQLSILEI